MRLRVERLVSAAAVMLSAAVLSSATEQSRPAQPAPVRLVRDYPVKPVPFTAVHVNDSFWAPRIEINRTVSIPLAFQKCVETGRMDNFERAAAVLRGEVIRNTRPPGYPFDDTDPYKVLEGASYSLSVHPDPQLEAQLDQIIAKIGAAQEKDGYLYTTRTINPASPHRWAGKERWVLEGVDSHELYNLGHLYEAAVAHFQATGKRTLLDIALKTADLLDRTFGPGKQSIWPGHQITEMGLAKLYRITGDQRYMNLAKFIIDERGPNTIQGSGRTYNQSHQKVVDQTEAVGHAVRATYMYSGVADVAALTGESSYVSAIDRIWENVAGKRIYITGGIGASGAGEAFGRNYELPNMSAYCETCAAIGNDFWNHRLFLLHGDAKYIDVMERTLYNGLISGVALDGKTYFYPNPLESNGQHQRSPWFGVACCPSNVTRFMASVPGYVYAQQGSALYVNLFMGSTADIELDGGQSVRIVQETRYPWDGDVKMTVTPDRAGTFTVNVRVPGWARNEAIASDLYRFSDRAPDPPVLEVNGRPVPLTLDKGYVALNRRWAKGDTISLSMPMPVRRVVSHELVEANRGRVALQRGPIVYCAEWPDNPDGKVRNLVLPDTAPLTAEFRPALLNGVQAVKARAISLAYDSQGKVNSREQDFLAIPYYAWANRGRGQMVVWIPNTAAAARPLAVPTVATTSRVTSSPGHSGMNLRNINDGEDVHRSSDAGSSYDWWPKKGTSEWVEYAFEKAASVSEVEVYWFDDTGRGEVRVPQSWRILYRDGEAWKPVETAEPYGVERDRFNRVTFKPVTTAGLRLEMTAQPNWSVGIQEWRVK